ncbi:hypothetical protein [Naasia aerilata]|uniref:PepSY domain-containing protein n=1 Tax=Naasia aerilata TaxID=1162966 RepID=A0ABN6XLJ7_9MICO|nr:hypothetical protein [Naasia aerilata]BDZ45794.1 hypothetical protein GCM10025866_17030 [Naasia aerilata]
MNVRKTMTIGGLLLAGGLTVGAITAAALPAVAETGTPTPSASSAPAERDPSQGGHQANGKTEELLTGDTAEKVRAAVVAAYPDATVQRLETDAEGAAYEAHIVQADGTEATVKLDESFAVTGLEEGGPGGGRPGHPDDDPATGTGTSGS